MQAINKIGCEKVDYSGEGMTEFGEGNSDLLFIELLDSEGLWVINHQKQFQEFKR